jgi:hypothetical protein
MPRIAQRAQVERVVPWHVVAMRRRLNALRKSHAAFRPDIGTFGESAGIVFGEADPPLTFQRIAR